MIGRRPFIKGREINSNSISPRKYPYLLLVFVSDPRVGCGDFGEKDEKLSLGKPRGRQFKEFGGLGGCIEKQGKGRAGY